MPTPTNNQPGASLGPFEQPHNLPKKSNQHPVATLVELLSYSRETGTLTWKTRSRRWFPCDRIWNSWNANYANKAAGGVQPSGYVKVSVLDTRFFAHHLAWAIHYGEHPSMPLDHIDGDGANNRIENLRLVTHAENCKNQKRNSVNTSGVVGVSWYKKLEKWQAQVGVSGKSIHLGYYKDFDAAVDARKQADREFGFHENHGRINPILKAKGGDDAN